MLTVGLLLLGVGLIAISAIVDQNNTWRYFVVVGSFVLGVKVLDLAFNMLFY